MQCLLRRQPRRLTQLSLFQQHQPGLLSAAQCFVRAMRSSLACACVRSCAQLAVEDHHWWWRSFLCGGATGLFVYGYCFYYYFYRSDMSGFMQVRAGGGGAPFSNACNKFSMRLCKKLQPEEGSVRRLSIPPFLRSPGAKICKCALAYQERVAVQQPGCVSKGLRDGGPMRIKANSTTRGRAAGPCLHPLRGFRSCVHKAPCTAACLPRDTAQASFFFGYMAMVCFGFFLMLGTIGWRASLLFVRHIYKAIKSE